MANLVINFLNIQSEKGRLQQQQNARPDVQQVARSKSWKEVKSGPVRSRKFDAAMNHWFIFNKGVPDRGQPLTYDPYGNMALVYAANASLANFDELWDCPQAKDLETERDQHDNFWRNFAMASQVRSNFAAVNEVAETSGTESNEEEINDEAVTEETRVTLEELFNQAIECNILALPVSIY